MIKYFNIKAWFKPAAPKLKPPLIEDYNLEAAYETYVPKDFVLRINADEEHMKSNFDQILERIEQLEFKVDKLL